MEGAQIFAKNLDCELCSSANMLELFISGRPTLILLKNSCIKLSILVLQNLIKTLDIYIVPSALVLCLKHS